MSNAIGNLRVVAFVMMAVAASNVFAGTAAGSGALDQETEQRRRLQQAQALIAAHRSGEAMPLIDQTLSFYAAKYPEGKTQWYVARTREESVLYLTESTMSGSHHSGQTNATVLDVAWAEAYFLKAYAYLELEQPNAAIAPIERALSLSPSNAKYLTERAEIDKWTRNWTEALALYREAETASAVSPPDEKAGDLAHAKRGQAFVLIEQGKLDAAERVLNECLKLDGNDAHARKELEYIAQLRKQAAPVRKK